ncbi:hypothetical protein DC366_02725 [Pelagivirga sediminicola]|uniref:Uncharacterized protein n=1 Tax=Pelagivirga sediminicola TaxID=2170575 RepID=A0A2T7GBV9_9RHOB|nr:hypothetical protein [Pelagivirga sediminicola]PVA11868.1 hypothetical protein DC366_02725 [Pelagivirga sediminicola]
MARARHILTGLLAAAWLAGCAPPVLDKYMGRPILDPMLDFGKPDEVFDLPDGRRAFQWKVEKNATRPSPKPVIGVGVGIGRGRWGGGWSQVTTVGTSYESYTKTCVYTLIGNRRGDTWIVTGQRRPAPGCA